MYWGPGSGSILGAHGLDCRTPWARGIQIPLALGLKVHILHIYIYKERERGPTLAYLEA